LLKVAVTCRPAAPESRSSTVKRTVSGVSSLVVWSAMLEMVGGTGVGVGVLVDVAVAVGVLVGVSVGVSVAVAVGVAVSVGV
jgi:hypothetical protein